MLSAFGLAGFLWLACPSSTTLAGKKAYTSKHQHHSSQRQSGKRIPTPEPAWLRKLHRFGLLSKRQLPTLRLAMRQCSKWMKMKVPSMPKKSEDSLLQGGTYRSSIVLGKLLFRTPPVTFREAWLIPTTYSRNRTKVTYHSMKFYYTKRVTPRMYQHSANYSMLRVRRQWRTFLYCYENSLKTNQSLRGKVSFLVVVGKSGRVKNVKVLQNQMDLPLCACLTRKIQALLFPPLHEQVTFVLPLVFMTAR